MKCKKGFKKLGDKCVKIKSYSNNMKRKFRWTSTKVIVTILIVAFFLFVLFQAGAFDKILGFLTTSTDPISQAVSGAGNGGGG